MTLVSIINSICYENCATKAIKSTLFGSNMQSEIYNNKLKNLTAESRLK